MKRRRMVVVVVNGGRQDPCPSRFRRRRRRETPQVTRGECGQFVSGGRCLRDNFRLVKKGLMLQKKKRKERRGKKND